jgi:hypothetical protein
MVFVRWRAVLLATVALVALALVLALTALGGGPPGSGGRSGSTGRAGAPPSAITIQAGEAGPRVPFGFLGLSLEYPAVETYAGADPRALDPVFVQLVRNLVPGQAPVLRIGGDSTDRTWWPTPGIPRPPGVTYAITPRWLEVTRALAHALGARLIPGLNLEAGSPALAASEARALLAGIGPGAVRALELGNEPDLYASFPWYRTADGRHVTGRPASYDMSSLIGDFAAFSAALPARPILAGPSLGAPEWTRQLGRFLAAEPRVGLVTLHRYPLQLCYTPRRSPRYPTVDHLLQPAASIGLADSFAPYVAIAKARRLPLRIDELNSVSCGADPSVSKTFASALWAINTLFAMARVGMHGVNIHTFPGAGYELFELRRDGGRWRATVAPEYYGLMLFARAAPAGARLLGVDGAVSGSVHTWATRGAGGTVRITMVNTGAQARDLIVGVAGDRVGRARLEQLTAPSPRSSTTVTLAGQSFAAPSYTGLLAGRAQTRSIAPVHGRYSVTLPGYSAVLLTL